MITTSNFARLKRIPPGLEPVSIALVTPRWAGKIRRYRALAPSPEIRGLALEEFAAGYLSMLAKLDPAQVVADVGPAAVLCCWEAAGFTCHRRMVADWLEAALDIEVPELGFPRSLIPPWQDAPLKGQRSDFPWRVNCDHCRAENEVALGAPRCRCIACRKSFAVTWD